MKTATIRQRFLRIVYPFWILITKLTGKNNSVIHNGKAVLPAQSLYTLSVQLNNGRTESLQQWKGKKLLLVNTASDCGYTAQYADLQKLWERYKHDLIVLGFPANDFKDQERGSDEAIAQFCQRNFGVTFPLAKKSRVIKGPDQHPVFQWLTDKAKNGWNDRPPVWNFSKYLVNEQGMLTHYFEPSVSPLHESVVNAVEQ